MESCSACCALDKEVSLTIQKYYCHWSSSKLLISVFSLWGKCILKELVLPFNRKKLLRTYVFLHGNHRVVTKEGCGTIHGTFLF